MSGYQLSDDVFKALIAGAVTVIGGLLAVVSTRLAVVHKLVNSAAAAQQEKLDQAATEIVELKRVIMLQQAEKTASAELADLKSFILTAIKSNRIQPPKE